MEKKEDRKSPHLLSLYAEQLIQQMALTSESETFATQKKVPSPNRLGSWPAKITWLTASVLA